MATIHKHNQPLILMNLSLDEPIILIALLSYLKTYYDKYTRIANPSKSKM